MKDEFSRFHPLVNLIFYLVVLGLTMFQMQLGLVLISIFSALVYFFCLKGQKGIKYLIMVGIIFLISSFINPLFSHKGGTLLFYLFTGNPVTLESILYGIVSSAIISGMLLWFSTFYQIMGVERMLGAVGRFMPHVALLISMILRFIPQYTKHQKEVSLVNREEDEKFIGKIKRGSRVFSITTTWALENSIYTADSMRARGFGVRKRTNYSNYKIEKRDIGVIIWIVILAGIVFWSLNKNIIFTYYYPYVVYRGNVCIYIFYTLLCLTPVFINIREGLRWHRLKSKI